MGVFALKVSKGFLSSEEAEVCFTAMLYISISEISKLCAKYILKPPFKKKKKETQLTSWSHHESGWVNEYQITQRAL